MNISGAREIRSIFACIGAGALLWNMRQPRSIVGGKRRGLHYPKGLAILPVRGEPLLKLRLAGYY